MPFELKLRILKFLFCVWFCIANYAHAFDLADDLLPPDQAFQFNAMAKHADLVEFSWDIAADYYMYRQKFKFVSLTPGIIVEKIVFPTGLWKHDEFFGDMEIFRDHVAVNIVLRQESPIANMATFDVISQGCAEEIGVCYPPIHKNITVDLPSYPAAESIAQHASAENEGSFVSEQDHIADALKNQSVWLTVLGFLGFGLLLAFTPCVFPMIPILSGIIAGQDQRLTTRRAFRLSLSYVLASSTTFTVFGVLAALFGNNLQALFQEPWVIIAFSSIFVLLALSMFGFFNIQMPEFIQSKVLTISAKQQSGSLWGAAVMGVLSTLIIGPCVTAPLAGALIYIGQTGNVFLGALALLALGIGMGIPLLIIGTSAGKLLPKAGAWMNVTKIIFGIGLLAVAVWLLSRIIPPAAAMFLWALLLAIPLMILSWRKLWKGFALFVLTSGIILLVGVSTHRSESVPSFLCNLALACEEHPTIAFTKISSIAELQQNLAEAQAKGQWIMLDFYADWCVTCHEMEHSTYSDPKVQSALSDVRLLQVDVTHNTALDHIMLNQFNLIGPPAVLFFAPDQQERTPYRVVGYIKADLFLSHLRQIFK
jgi:thiol:disulfide interchange protein DsbD